LQHCCYIPSMRRDEEPQFGAKLGASAICRIRPASAAPFFVIVIAMVLACVVIWLTASAATIEGDNPK
jgi:hypothetical protein